ncbi:acyltransferase [Chishuiella sp.]|uniref:acyltransferase n=1 Tax=Chishuiella sp. TaxID=1969467 RepID=UPI0028AA5AEE|nr:acyltransferase [Chishuiella sp.]
MKIIIQVLFFMFPWKIRRILLNKIFKYDIHKTSKIGYSIILSKKLLMEKHSRIGNFSFCQGIDLLHLKEYGRLGTFNYITGYSSYLKSHFSHVKNRKCEFIIGKHSAVTSRHFLDATAGIYIGNYTTFAGIKSQILTHSIDIELNIQDAEMVEIGDYCFVGTACIFLKGSKLPNNSILGANSLLNKKNEKECALYGGVPARYIKDIPIEKYKYFQRKIGFVK